MSALDWVVLFGYFVAMAGIGYWAMWKIKKQEDFFLGGRSFGKLLQAFAAFGAGTGANDPVLLGRTIFTSGLSGIWSVLLWLFVTPFYWIFGVWYRRMRHLTLGDWFVERYESRSLGAAYALFAIYFYMVYLSVAFAAVGKVGIALIGSDTVQLGGATVDVYHLLLPIIAAVVILYGVMGGLRAAYWTDLVQGIFIILLSVLLIPSGLQLLVAKFGDPGASWTEGFRIMHQRVPAEYFEILESPRGGEFPLYYIVAITLINLIGIVVQPHFIATGGGSAKTETSARVGLVAGNFLKRLCTVGWALTGLIVLALLADNLEIAQDADRVWGVAAREVLGPLGLGLVGLMLACLLAALMSSADCYMLVTSALVVRNIYAAYINPKATEAAYVRAGRIVGTLIIAGATTLALLWRDVFDQMKAAWEIPLIFAAVFWVGMYWRRATRWAAWGTVLFAATVFFFLPRALPWMLGQPLRTDPRFTKTTDLMTLVVYRQASASDVARRDAQRRLWAQRRAQLLHQAGLTPEQIGQVELGRLDPRSVLSGPALEALEALGPEPAPLKLGDAFQDRFLSGGKAIYWTGSVVALDEQGRPTPPKRHPVLEAHFETNQVRLVEHTPQGPRERVFSTRDPDQLAAQGAPGRVVRVARSLGGHRATCTWERIEPGQKLRGQGQFNLEFFLYDYLGWDLTGLANPMLETLRLPPRIIAPFLVMILLSWITPKNSPKVLDRYYVKMKTPVDPNPEKDAQELQRSYENPHRYDHKKLFPGTQLEFQKPTWLDVVGFVVSFGICFLIIALAVWVANLGA